MLLHLLKSKTGFFPLVSMGGGKPHFRFEYWPRAGGSQVPTVALGSRLKSSLHRSLPWAGEAHLVEKGVHSLGKHRGDHRVRWKETSIFLPCPSCPQSSLQGVRLCGRTQFNTVPCTNLLTSRTCPERSWAVALQGEAGG